MLNTSLIDEEALATKDKDKILKMNYRNLAMVPGIVDQPTYICQISTSYKWKHKNDQNIHHNNSCYHRSSTNRR